MRTASPSARSLCIRRNAKLDTMAAAAAAMKSTDWTPPGDTKACMGSATNVTATPRT